jgi:cellulose synthase/poly-beta-1,6-N-acetylglucosamine synthase-like glycosyltransferase
MPEKFGQYGRLRFWEMVPGFLTWGTFFLAIFSSLFLPWAAVIFIIIFDLYWALRVLYFLVYVSIAYGKYRHAMRVDWLKQLHLLPRWKEIQHIVLLPTYGESLDILHEALHAVANSAYPNDKMIVVVGGEEGDEQNFRTYQKVLEKDFSGTFQKLLFTVHPKGLPGEIPGKGSNLKWMAGQVRTYIDEKRYLYSDLIVHAFDVDTRAHEQYFARVAYLFLTEPKPLRTSYQPLTLFSNNIWTATAPVRISSFGTTFWLLGELVRPERMWTFSSHSMPWQMLVDVGYHEPDLVSEDSRIFMQGFLHYDGDYRVTPVYLPVHMDAVESETFMGSLKALYKQQRRWAWGVEHLPYMIAEFRKHPKIPKRLKARFLFNHLEGMYTWTTAPILIFVLGYLPFFVAGDTTSALIANAPFSLERMMQVATVGVFASGLMSFFFLPPRPQTVKKWNWGIMILQWALLPVTFVLFGAFPAIDAQTRFLLGKYLGFNVTKKLKRDDVG